MSWLVDDRVRPVPARAACPGSLEAIDDSGGLPALTPIVGRSPDGVVRGWRTAEPVNDPHEDWR